MNWTKVSDALPTEYGTYLVVRGLWFMGMMDYKIGVTDFHPKGWQHGGHWYDRGFIYTHWIGPIAKPEMPLEEFPILKELGHQLRDRLSTERLVEPTVYPDDKSGKSTIGT